MTTWWSDFKKWDTPVSQPWPAGCQRFSARPASSAGPSIPSRVELQKGRRMRHCVCDCVSVCHSYFVYNVLYRVLFILCTACLLWKPIQWLLVLIMFAPLIRRDWFNIMWQCFGKDSSSIGGQSFLPEHFTKAETICYFFQGGCTCHMCSRWRSTGAWNIWLPFAIQRGHIFFAGLGALCTFTTPSNAGP